MFTPSVQGRRLKLCLARRSVFGGAGLVCLALATACGSGSDGSVPNEAPSTSETARLEAVIGPEGGELVGQAGTPFEGVKMTVPAGAIASATKLSITSGHSTTPLPATAIPCGPEFNIEPAGLAFAQPATLSLPVDANTVDEQNRLDDETKVWKLTADGWGQEPQIDSSEGSVTIELSANTTVVAGVNPVPAADIVRFSLKPSAKVLQCFAQYPDDPNRQPQVDVIVVRNELNDSLRLRGRYIKPGLKFDMFTVENSPFDKNFAGNFGLAWYQSDLEADKWGSMRVNIRTILLDQIFGFDPTVNLAPTSTFHLGFWFNDPNDAAACGFDVTHPTPFNGDHKAGPVAMISAPNADTTLGPLCTHADTSVSPARCDP